MEELTKEVCIQISEIYKIDLNIVLQNKNKNFFTEPFYFTPELLLYLYFHIKKKHEIKFSTKELVDGTFLNIENICNAIQRNR